jgi:predicted CopG family antitoxin
MERTNTTIRVRPSTVRKLSKLGRKGESYDRVIRRLIQKELPEVPDIDELSATEIEDAMVSPDIPADRIDWNKVFEMDDDEFRTWLKKVATA